jgi:long-chain fatty acid transport protein
MRMASNLKYIIGFCALATAVFATNGDSLIGLGAKSRAMGGTGIAHFNGSESANSNPALITKSSGTHITFGGTYFRPDVEVSTNGAPVTDVTATSDAKHNVIPFITLTENLNNGFAIGASMFGSAGMGTDWRDESSLYSMRSNLLLLKFSLPIAYGQDNWSVGVAPVLMYGAMDMSFNDPNNAGADVGNGSSADFGLGAEFGAAYTLPEMGLTLAATYHTSIEMEYKDQISTTATAFGYNTTGELYFNDKLEQPAEYGFGIDWTQGDISLTADYKRILWGTARGYEDFKWENQNVFALGAEYRMDKLALRAGYNYAKNPLNTLANDGERLNVLNHVMFPAVTERHYTIGTGYQFTKNVAADFAFTYATSPKVTVDGSGVNLGSLTVTNDQMAVSANLNYSF